MLSRYSTIPKRIQEVLSSNSTNVFIKRYENSKQLRDYLRLVGYTNYRINSKTKHVDMWRSDSNGYSSSGTQGLYSARIVLWRDF